jgi:energy-coupling factor transporter ATP-binding protein EcfA2
MAIIELREVCFTQPTGLLALDRISFDIEKKEVVAIVGGNGAGKTTLLKHLNGLLKPTSGSLKIFGRETRKQNVAELSRRVGLVFQNSDHQLFSRTVEEEVLFGLKNFKFTEEASAKRCKEVMEFFGLEPLRSRVPLTLSGGEKKRLCIAAVMAWNPDILVLDEPTVGQDPKSKTRIFEVIKGLEAVQKTVIIVTHDLEFLWPLGARTIVMNHGRVIADGDPSLIFSDKRVLDEAGLRQPQMMTISKALPVSAPFINAMEAAQWFAKR